MVELSGRSHPRPAGPLICSTVDEACARLFGRRMLAGSARRFQERGIESFVLFAEISNPTVGFFDHMGGERLLDERGRFVGAFAWRDLRPLISAQPRRRMAPPCSA